MSPFLPLRIFIPLLLLLSSSMAGLASLYYLLPKGDREVEEESMHDMRQIMNLLQSSINIMLRRNDTDGVRTQLTSLATDNHTNILILVDEHSKVMVAAHKEREGKVVGKVAPFLAKHQYLSLKRLNAGYVSLSKDRQSVRAVYPVNLPEQGKKLRATRVGMLVFEKNILHNKIIEKNNVEKHVGMFFALTLCIATLLWMVFHFSITRRVNRLVEVAGKVAEGDLSVRIGLHGRDEFARIGKSLDNMTVSLAKNQHELIVSEERLRMSQVYANIGTWEWNIKSNDVYWSDTIAPIFGCAQGEVHSYEDFIRFVHPDDRDVLEHAILRCVGSREKHDVKYRAVRPDGSIRWVHEQGDVVRDVDGTPWRMLGIVRDITQEKESELRLQDTMRELSYQKYAVDQHSIVAVTDLAGKITYANDKFNEISGYSDEELLGNTHIIVNSGFHTKEFFTNMWCTISAGETWRGEVCNRKKNAEIYWVDTTIVPHLDEKGKPDRYITIRTDITERKRTDAQLHVQASALKAAADGIVITEKNGDIQWVNPAYTRLTGYHFSEVVGKNLRIMKSGKQDRIFYQKLWHTILAGRTWQAELWNKRKDGSVYLEEEIITPVLNSSGKIGHFVAIKRDISERKQLQRQLQQSQKMEAIGQLTGGIAHDFNNMLASIMGYTELAREGLAQYKNGKIEGYLSEVYKSGQRARDLVAQMLAFSRGGEGDLKPLALSPLIRESLKMIGATLPSSIEIDLRLDDEDLTVMTNPVQLHQLVMNLCINSRDAMQGKGHITIGLRRANDVATECRSCHERVRGDYIELFVGDTGGGIRPEQLDRIFDPFYTTKDVGKGTGMGLSMVHGIMHDHGGHIVVETEPGKNTTFALLFPVMDARGDTVNEACSNAYTSSFKNLDGNILIVDDEVSVGRFIGELLQGCGYYVTVETDSRSALSIFKLDPAAFDLVVTDQTMPGMTGEELAQEVMAIRPEIPVVLCTGYSDHIDEARARSLGISGYVNKPIETDKFLGLVASQLKVILS